MKIMKRENYLTPNLEIIEVQIEQGFATSDLVVDDWASDNSSLDMLTIE